MMTFRISLQNDYEWRCVHCNARPGFWRDLMLRSLA